VNTLTIADAKTAFDHVLADGTSHSGVDGVVTIHSDVSDAGSGIIISDAERTAISTATSHITADGTSHSGVDGVVTIHSDVSDAGSGIIISDAERTAYDAADAHVSADGSSHGFIDQSVVSGATPTFTGTNFTGIDISAGTNLAAGTGITLTGDTLSTNDGEIDHNSLNNYVADEHIDWTNATDNFLTTGTGEFTGNVGIGAAADYLLDVSQSGMEARFQNTTAGVPAIVRTMPGLWINSNALNSGTFLYGTGIKFGSIDGSFTTENPKFLAGIMPRALENYGADTDSGMAIDFMTCSKDEGATVIPTVRMSIADTIEIKGSSFSPAYDSFTGLKIDNSAIVAGDDVNGIPIEFSTLGAGRKRAAIVPIQETNDADRMSLGFFVSNTNLNTADIEEAVRITWDKDLHVLGGTTIPLLVKGNAPAGNISMYLQNDSAADVSNTASLALYCKTSTSNKAAGTVRAGFTGITDASRKSFMSFKTAIGGAFADRILIDDDGGVFMYNLKSGTDQANAGASADEIYVDTDDQTLKLGT